MERIVISKEYDYFERQRAIKKLCDRYPFIKTSLIGKSCGGKDINSLKIGASDSYNLIVAGVHGSERITSTVLLMFIEELANAVQREEIFAGVNAKKAIDCRGMIFVPCVNPDGCDISLLGVKGCGGHSDRIHKLCKGDFEHWNANLRGVDINHNFDAGWQELRQKERECGIYGSGPTRFGGTKPHSEPETVALVNLCRKNNIRQCLALHSQGEVIYWDYGEKTPKKSKKIAEIMATAAEYALDTPLSIATGGGFKDWFIETYSRPGFTVEIGNGQNPLSAELSDEIYERIKEMLMLFAIM